MATAALVFGIVSLIAPWAALRTPYLAFLCWVPSVLAVALGDASLSRIRESNEELPGRRQAHAGLVLGIVGLVLWLLALVALVYWAHVASVIFEMDV